MKLSVILLLVALCRSAAGNDYESSFRSLQEEEPFFQHGVECTPCSDTTDTCVINVKVNFFAGENGYYEFDGCDGVNPTLLLTVGKTYMFDQTDITNWYHLLGFAYEADGAHTGVDELEPGVPPGNATCADNLSCPAPMYFMAGEYQGVYSNIPDLVAIPANASDDFGLDAVEPLFFHPLGDWQEYGEMAVYLNFDQNYDQDFFYFCHVHSRMSGRIKLLDAVGNKINPNDTPELPYAYDEISSFDYGCGTFNLSDWQLSTEDGESGRGDFCPPFFVCANDGVEKSNYVSCVEAMNCHMMASMTTTAEGSNSALFCHQMIPHHQNAVNMAKSLLHAHSDVITCDTSGPVEEGDVQPWACDLLPILYDIINNQNHDIMKMRDALVELGVSEFANCDVSFEGLGIASASAVSKRILKTPSRELQQEEATSDGLSSSQDCEPCSGTSGECEVVLKVNLFAGERGYYEVDGCEGVNPTLHLTVGRTYKFDQSDISNWYHLIGFAYFPDGAHSGVDELEPGIPPGGSSCADDLSCPAPMYFMDGEYQGNYSNIPDLVAIPSPPSDDFGLGAVEPLFFHPIRDWQEYGPMTTYLNFDQEYDQDIFYFCHLHSGMTGRIKLKSADGNMLNEGTSPPLGYEYDIVSGHDAECGTFGLNDFTLPNDQCPERFVCYDLGGTLLDFVKCIDSMNCAMLDGMTNFYGGDGISVESTNDVVLFIRQMIPHHQNAVNMAKALLKSGEATCETSGPVEEGDALSAGCLLEPIARSIIAVQNRQIQDMEGILEAFRIDSSEFVRNCDFAPISDSSSQVVDHLRLILFWVTSVFAILIGLDL